MSRKLISFAIGLILLVSQLALPAAASAQCVPYMELGFVELFGNDTVRFSIRLDEADCGAPNEIGVLYWLDYISRTDVNQPWSDVNVLQFQTILYSEMPLYQTSGGDYIIANVENIDNKVDDEFSKFRLRVYIYDNATLSHVEYSLGWMDGPNDWQPSGGFGGRPGGWTPQQNQGVQLKGQN